MPLALPHPLASHPRALLPPLVALCALATPAPARAEANEWALTLGAGIAGLHEAADADAESKTRLAPTLNLALRYGLDDFFQLGVALEPGLAVDGPSPTGLLLGELHYVIDIVTWAPRLTVGVGALARTDVPSPDGPTDRLDLALSLGAGLEYRQNRDWGVAFSGRYLLVPTDFARFDGWSAALGLTLFFE